MRNYSKSGIKRIASYLALFLSAFFECQLNNYIIPIKARVKPKKIICAFLGRDNDFARVTKNTEMKIWPRDSHKREKNYCDGNIALEIGIFT